MSRRASTEEKLPDLVTKCAGCGIRFEVNKKLHDLIKEDEYHAFGLDLPTQRSVLVVTVCLPRCPKCTDLVKGAISTAKEKSNLPVLLFESEEILKNEVQDTPTSEDAEAEATT